MTSHKLLSTFLPLLLSSCVAGTEMAGKHHQQDQQRLNVLYFIVDDLRPEFLKAYNQTIMVTPNIDKLAETGLTFDRAFCQQAVCGPTRNRFVRSLVGPN